MSGVTVTPTGVREGDPAALEALCAVRGPSVVAYCRHVAGEAETAAAACDAFARFRVAVVAAGDTNLLNPESLLISATRTSAAARARVTALGHCAQVPALLAARAEKTIAPADLERLEAHLDQCWTCRAPVARFKAAERAYRDPPETTVEPALSEQIVAALVAAVPPAPPPEPPAPSMNGSADAGATADPQSTAAASVDEPTEPAAAPATDEPEPTAAAAAYLAAAEARRRRRATRRTGALALLSRLKPASASRGPREHPSAPEPPAAGAPRERRSERSRPPLRLAVVLPIVLVLLALIAALYVSGVFGGNDPESSPRVAVPAATPADTTKPELVIVPGTKDASADAIERAKARARGEDDPGAPTKRKAAPASARRSSAPAPAAAGSPPPAAATPPPAPPAAPAISPNNPVTRPAPERDRSSRTSPQKQIDAGSGATGAEQIPPAADATDVPDLAPPPEPATP